MVSINTKEKYIPQNLKKQDLEMEETKTEEYTITRNRDDKWKKCKFLKSLRATDSDQITKSCYRYLEKYFLQQIGHSYQSTCFQLL